MSKKYGAGISFLIGLLVGGIGNILLALIVWLIAKEKFDGKYYWIGAFITIILMIIILGIAFLFGLFGLFGNLVQNMMR